MFEAIKNLMLCIFAGSLFYHINGIDGFTLIAASALGLSVMSGVVALAHFERWLIKRQGYLTYRR